MNKNELIDAVSEKAPCLTKNVISIVINTAMETIQETVANDEKVTLVGFGTFERRTRKARNGVHPITKEKIKIPKKNIPYFKPGSDFKNKVLAGKKRGRKKKAD